MAGGEKPYRVYRGGRVKGGVPLPAKPARRAKPSRDGRYPGPGPVRRARRRSRRRQVAIGLGVLVLVFLAWAVAGYLSVRSGVHAANDRLGQLARAELTPQEGLLLSRSTHFLLLGIDHSKARERSGLLHSDSIMVVRTDPDRHRIAYLSIPRDLRVVIPGHGPSKINAASQIGGPALTIRTVRRYTGLPIHHVVIVDFADFEDLIDTLGGITVDVPAPIVSNRFDCPYRTQAQCERWPGWRFRKGRQRMDGRRALIYSRIRENRLDPGETDLARGERQQQVLQALTSRLVSPATFARLPFVGDDLLEPLATDLATGQFLQLAWLKFRSPAGRALHCRLGGTSSNVGGESVILPTEENFGVIHMVTGAAAPQPPLPGSGPFGPGCVVGERRFK